MKKWRLRLCALIAAAGLTAGLSGCGKPVQEGKVDAGTSAGVLFSKPTELDVTICSHVSWPYNENWKMWQYLKEATGAQLNIQAVPSSDIATKLPLLMASPDTVPDLLHLFSKQQYEPYAESGAFLSLDERAEQMPNYTAFIDGLSPAEREDLLNQRRSGDGRIYSAPSYGTQTVNSMRVWLYRRDIFEKHGLPVPETYEELYTVCKTLKELYPESYPLCFREGIRKLITIGPSWQNDFTPEGYFDFQTKQWRYGAQEPVMKEMVEYFVKLANDGLTPPDMTTMETKSWEELMSTDRGFITVDYAVRIDFFNLAARQENPEYTLAIMAPPKADSLGGTPKLEKNNLDFSGYLVCNTGDQKRMDASLRLVDWMYSAPAVELLSWGKENETYRVEDGRRTFILKEGEQASNAYGVGTYGLYQVIDEEAYEATYTEENVAACRQALTYLEENANPVKWLTYPEDEADQVTQLYVEINAYLVEQLSLFLLRQQPMSEWDVFQKGLKEIGVDKLLDHYRSAYERAMEKA